MTEGRVRAALRLLSDNPGAQPLNLDMLVDGKTVMEILKDRHSDPRPAHPDILLDNTHNNSFHPAIFENITGEFILTAALYTQGSARPSGLDVRRWRRLCTAFGQKFNDLCTALALVAR